MEPAEAVLRRPLDRHDMMQFHSSPPLGRRCKKVIPPLSAPCNGQILGADVSPLNTLVIG